MTRRTAARPEPVRDLFAPPATWTPPKEFTDFLAERKRPTLAAAPTLVQPARAVEAAADVAPPRRDFAAQEERVTCTAGIAVRSRTTSGNHIYWAFERTDVFFHAVHLAGDIAWGRIDTRRPAMTLSPEDERTHQRVCEAEAVAAIVSACIETASVGEPPSCGVFLSPGYVLVIVDPEIRYQAARAREVPA